MLADERIVRKVLELVGVVTLLVGLYVAYRVFFGSAMGGSCSQGELVKLAMVS